MVKIATALEQSRWARRLLVPVIVVELVAAGGLVMLHAADSTEAFDAADALSEFGRETAVIAEAEVAPSPLAGASPESTTTAPTVTAPVTDVTAAGSPAATDPGAPPTTATPAGGIHGTTPEAAGVPTPYPAEGVYVYATDGYESTDALGGSHHEYPAETTITVVHGDCGFQERWQPLHERYDLRTVCGAGDRHLAGRFVQYHEFYGQNDVRDLRCEDGATVFFPRWQAGDVSEFRCSDERTDTVSRFTVIGREPIAIGGVTVEAIHARVVSTATGESTADSAFDSWMHPDTGLVLKRVSLVDGNSPGPGGRIAYHEEYTITLQSLEPLR